MKTYYVDDLIFYIPDFIHCIAYADNGATVRITMQFLRKNNVIAQTMPSQDVCLCVCLSVYPSDAGILSKRLNMSSNFFHHWVATAF